MNYFEIYSQVTLVGPDSMTFSGVEGWRYIAIEVDSASASGATISSSYDSTIGGKTNGTIVRGPGKVYNIGTGDNSIDGVTITAPSGCTVYVGAVKFKPVT